MENETHDYKYDSLVRETDKAFLIRFGDDDVWFPKSQVDLDHVAREITVPDWLAEKKGIEFYRVD